MAEVADCVVEEAVEEDVADGEGDLCRISICEGIDRKEDRSTKGVLTPVEVA